ncbi:MAG: hypothetical protein WBG41_16840 [Acidimicrobiales bacterium]
MSKGGLFEGFEWTDLAAQMSTKAFGREDLTIEAKFDGKTSNR